MAGKDVWMEGCRDAQGNWQGRRRESFILRENLVYLRVFMEAKGCFFFVFGMSHLVKG